VSASGWLVTSTVLPLLVALSANRSTSLVHANVWLLLAWAGWLLAASKGTDSTGYLALVLTGCAGVAVFGARRPGAAAWNFVVVGLSVVLSLPILEAEALGTPVQPGTFRTVFLASLVGTTVINYLPTRLGPGAALLAVGCGCEFIRVVAAGAPEVGMWCVGLAPWLGWLGVVTGPRSSSRGDRLWRSFRDRFGLVWGQRLREQFNRAAANAGLRVELRWTGMRPADHPAAVETLAALMKRFLP
jgi:hypothetical protein